MAGFAGTMRKMLLLSGLASLIAAIAVVSAAEDREAAALETQPEKKASQQEGGESKAASSPADSPALAAQSVMSSLLRPEANSIDQLLSQSSKTNDLLDGAASKEKILKLTTYGLGALAGLGGLTSLAGVAYRRRKGEPPSGKSTAFGAAAALATILGVTGAALAHWQKRKAEEKVKTYARDLLAQRQAMLSKLNDVAEPELEEVLARVDDIATAADERGMYVPDLSDSLPTPNGDDEE